MHLHVKRQLDLRLQVAVVNFEKSVHKFSQINILGFAQIHHGEESLANNAW